MKFTVLVADEVRVPAAPIVKAPPKFNVPAPPDMVIRVFVFTLPVGNIKLPVILKIPDVITTCVIRVVVLFEPVIEKFPPTFTVPSFTSNELMKLPPDLVIVISPLVVSEEVTSAMVKLLLLLTAEPKLMVAASALKPVGIITTLVPFEAASPIFTISPAIGKVVAAVEVDAPEMFDQVAGEFQFPLARIA